MSTIDRIRAALSSEHCSTWARNTIEDILDRARSYGGSVTAGQDKLIWKLVDEIEGKAAWANRGPACVDLSKITAMFATASAQLKRPFVCFLVGGEEFRVSQAPATGKNPGCLYVKRGSAYQGKIAPDGSFSAARDATPGILEALTAFAKDPAGFATAYGQATGSCCFCARELTDQRSVFVGYGPICASRWGLPWGVEALSCEEVA